MNRGKRFARLTPEQLAILLAILLAHFLVFLAPLICGFVGAAMLLFLLPGWSWVACIDARTGPAGWPHKTPHKVAGMAVVPSWVERFILSVGLSVAFSTLAGLVIHYVPGPVARWQVLLACDLVIGLGLLAGWLSGSRQTSVVNANRSAGPESVGQTSIPAEASAAMESRPTVAKAWSSSSLYVLLAILILAGVYRFVWLGYSEFQGDEALVTWSAARSLAGEDDILFLHGKSPAEIILPANLWALTGWVNEWSARFPFALAGWMSVLIAYVLGRRLLGERTALVATFLFALNGYLIGFSRVVQYQSLVVLMSLLAVYSAWRALENDSGVFQVMSALFAGVGLLAHYDAVLILPVVAWLWLNRFWWRKVIQGASKSLLHRRWAVAALSLVILLLILAAFYVPMAQDLQFKEMFSYLTGSRVGSNWFNNHLGFFLTSGTVYNSSYYTAIVVIALVGLIALRHSERSEESFMPEAETLHSVQSDVSRHSERSEESSMPGAETLHSVQRDASRHSERSEESRIRYAAVILLLLMATTVLWPAWWQIGAVNLAIVPFVLLLLGMWFSSGRSLADRTLWLWLGVAALSYLFVLALPLSHIYVIMPPLILLAASSLERLLVFIARFITKPSWLRYSLYIVLGAILLALAYYPHLVFVSHQPEFTQAYLDRPVPLYWRPYDRLPQVGLFGFPHRSGWKAAGWMYDTGVLRGDYLSNEEEWVTLWYTHFAPTSCSPDADYYLLAVNPWDATPAPDDLISAEYRLAAAVTVDGEPRLRVYARQAAEPLYWPGGGPSLETMADSTPLLDVSEIEAAFDQSSGPERFVQNARPQHELSVLFGNEIRLLGYDLEAIMESPGHIRPGGRLDLTLYWLALQPVPEDYHVFVQLGDEKLWAQSDGVPVCNRLPTSLWRPGKTVVDRRRLDIDLAAPKGTFPLRVGLYLPETGERLRPEPASSADHSVVIGRFEILPDDAGSGKG